MPLNAGSNGGMDGNSGGSSEAYSFRADGNSTYNYSDDTVSQLQNRLPYVTPAQQLQIQQRYFQEGATIHFERLQGPQVWAPLFLTGSIYHTASVLKNVVITAQISRRRLTSAEVDAVSEHADAAARKRAWMSRGPKDPPPRPRAGGLRRACWIV